MYKSTTLRGAMGLVVFLTAGCAWITHKTSPSSDAGPVGATITIGADGGVTPGTVDIRPGQAVTFVNKDSKEHLIFSNPHPVHTDCRPVNSVGKLEPGQTRNTATFDSVRKCGFHDHSDPGNAALHGVINIAN